LYDSAGASTDSSSSLSLDKCCWTGDFWREALRFPGFSRDDPCPSEGGVAGLDLAVEYAVREGDASERRAWDDVADVTFEGSGAGFFASGTLSVRMVGVALGRLNVLLLKKLMIWNVLQCYAGKETKSAQ
jgi:hypothetical protein